jgi:hypothetical protein
MMVTKIEFVRIFFRFFKLKRLKNIFLIQTIIFEFKQKNVNQSEPTG